MMARRSPRSRCAAFERSLANLGYPAGLGGH
jgi:hypothetical protein